MNRFNPSVGHYFQHTSETCIIAAKDVIIQASLSKSNVVISPRKFQSQKPWVIHELFESLGCTKKAELFGRSVNLRANWKTFGMEVLPESDDCWVFLRDSEIINKSEGNVLK